jgi:hypothetical protein
MRNLFKVILLSFLLCALSAVSSEKCGISKDALIFIKNEIADEMGESSVKNEKNPSDCNNLITQGTNLATRLRNQIKSKKRIDESINSKNKEFYHKVEVVNFNATMEAVKGYARSTYLKKFQDLNNTIQDLNNEMQQNLKNQLPLQLKLDFYNLMNNHGEINLDESLHDTQNTCEKGTENLFKLFDEIRELSHLSHSDACFSKIRDLMNVRALMKQSSKYEKNAMIAFEMSLEDQHRLIKKYTSHIKEGRKDYDSLGDDLAKLKAHSIGIKKNEETLHNLIPTRAFECLRKIIQNGKNFALASEAISDAEGKGPKKDVLDIALKEAYKCNEDAIINIKNLLDRFGGDSKIEWLIEEMRKCNHLGKIVFLEIADSSKKNFTKEKEEIYKNLAERIRTNPDEAMKDVKKYEKILDLLKLFDKVYNSNSKNLEVTQKFVEKLDPNLFYESKILVELNLDPNTKLEHFIKYGFWLKDRSTQMKNDKTYLDKMKKLWDSPSLPLEVHTLCSATFGLVSARDERNALIMPGTKDPKHQFVNFKAELFKTDKGLFFNLKNPSSQKPLSLCIDKKSSTVFFKENAKKEECVWEFEFDTSDNCKRCVSIKDNSNGKYLTSNYQQNGCAEHNFIRKCTAYHHYNEAKVAPESFKLK